MYKTILKYIGQLKTAEQRLIVLLLLSAVIVLFSLRVSDINSSKNEDKQEIQALKYQRDSIQKEGQKRIDECEDNKFRAELERRIELEKLVHRQDSLLEQLRKIK